MVINFNHLFNFYSVGQRQIRLKKLDLIKERIRLGSDIENGRRQDSETGHTLAGKWMQQTENLVYRGRTEKTSYASTCLWSRETFTVSRDAWHDRVAQRVFDIDDQLRSKHLGVGDWLPVIGQYFLATCHNDVTNVPSARNIAVQRDIAYKNSLLTHV